MSTKATLWYAGGSGDLNGCHLYEELLEEAVYLDIYVDQVNLEAIGDPDVHKPRVTIKLPKKFIDALADGSITKAVQEWKKNYGPEGA